MKVTRLPLIVKAATVIGKSNPVAELYVLMLKDSGQRRKEIHWHQGIAAVAQARCDAMLRRGAIFHNHLDDNGRGPNLWLRQAGIAIPDWYSHYPGEQGPGDHENNVESIGLNYATAADCWRAWLLSPTHRAHCLGYEPTFDVQTQIGIGYATGAEAHPNFWVLVSVPPVEGS